MARSRLKPRAELRRLAGQPPLTHARQAELDREMREASRLAMEAKARIIADTVRAHPVEECVTVESLVSDGVEGLCLNVDDDLSAAATAGVALSVAHRMGWRYADWERFADVLRRELPPEYAPLFPSTR